MVKKSKEMELAQELLLKTFSFLENDYLYVPKFCVIDSAVFLEYGKLEYTNEIKKRIIDISYTKGSIDGEIKYTFSLSIVRNPYSSLGDMIALNNFLASKNSDFDTRIYGEFEIHKVESILRKIADVLYTDLEDVIDGNVWYETYYPKKD
ncbi:MAG: hypothetical protein K0S53_1682 [Bacteroidetes bacterium]|nr:hypothetical protein [Bacteroidota bacterium]MDF2450527.1 hypothetical protein [Bacteroidota bacterium]